MQAIGLLQSHHGRHRANHVEATLHALGDMGEVIECSAEDGDRVQTIEPAKYLL